MRLAIIGGGFSAVCVLHQLVKQHVPLQSVSVYEPRRQPGEGVAYGDASETLLLNTRAAAMGLCPDQPGAFADWAGLEGEARHAFLPRRRYAAYLRGCLRQDLLDARFAVEFRHQRADAVSRVQGGFRIASAGGTDAFDAVVLATGAPRPAPLAAVEPGLPGDPRYVDDVWSEDWLGRVQPDEHVVVLGTGLTMVDQLQRLRDAGHRGPVTALSRRGQLPQVHAAHPHPQALAPALADALASQPLRAFVRTLRAQVAASDDWRDLLDALRPHHRALWSRLRPAERRAFLRHLRPWWDTHRHRMAPEAHALVQQAIDEGRLRIVAGSVLAVQAAMDRLLVRFRPRGSAGGSTLEADRVLRATGFGFAVESGRDPLFDSLLQAGLLAPDPLGLGVSADAACRVLDPRGRAVEGLHAVGPLLAGRWWEATAVPDIRIDAQALARALAGQASGAAGPACDTACEAGP